MNDYLLIGKKRGRLREAENLPARDAFFANDDEPGLELQNRTVQRAIWVNVSTRESKFVKCDFSYTMFVNCYFRGALFYDCDFTGCRFVDCNFGSSSMHSCKLRYSRWERTEIARGTLLDNLPAEGNLAQKLLIQLRLNAASVGEYDDARYYLYEAEKRSREHFLEIIKCRKDYYRKKYAYSAERLLAPFRYASSLTNYALWGYGERPLKLSLNGLLLILVFGVVHALADDSISLWAGVRMSFSAFVSVVPSVGVGSVPAAVTGWQLAESLLGIVYIAFLAASLHRRVATRRD